MANKIKPKRSYTASSVPLTSDLDTHELAIRWDSSSPAIFTKDASGNIVTVALGGGGSSSVVTAATVSGFPATGTAGVLYAALDTGRIYEWQGAYLEMGVSGGGTDSVLRALFVPAAPTSVTATGGNAQATVSWTAPTVLAQTPITDYTVQYSTNSGSSWTTFTDGTSTDTTATVTGLTNGTAYTFRVAGVNGVGTGSYSTASSAVTPIVGDAYFSNVSLLLHMEGTGSSFVDSSGTPKTITAFNSATQSSAQSKFGGKSGLFNPSGGNDYITAPSNSVFSFQTGDLFTIELWYYPTSFGTYNYLVSKGAGSVYREWGLGCTASSVNWYIKTGGSDVNYVASATVSLSTWTHLAVACNGTTVRIYKDGSLIGTTSFSTPDGYGQASVLTVGKFLDYSNIAHEARGYIDDLRITKGSNRGYTGSTITVPTAQFPDA